LHSESLQDIQSNVATVLRLMENYSLQSFRHGMSV